MAVEYPANLMGLKPRRRLLKRQFDSAILGNSRSVWIQTPAPQRHPAPGVHVFLDAEHYLGDVGAATIVAQLQRDGRLAGLLPVYVSHVDYPTRWRESFCNPDFGRFLSTELLPWITGEFNVDPQPHNALVGLSLTGLAAAHAALHHPHTLHRVLCQSGSFWWRDGQLIDDVLRLPSSELSVCLSVGVREIDENVDHGDGLFQKEAQLSANRRMRQALATRGFRVGYWEFDGGHDIASFRKDLPRGLSELGTM